MSLARCARGPTAIAVSLSSCSSAVAPSPSSGPPGPWRGECDALRHLLRDPGVHDRDLAVHDPDPDLGVHDGAISVFTTAIPPFTMVRPGCSRSREIRT